jgi:hypothetical protein
VTRGRPALAALFYLHDLQAGDWLTAAQLLSKPERLTVQIKGSAYAAALGRDVLAHAGGHRLGTCTTARNYSPHVALVGCGKVTVAVHHGDAHNLPGIWLGASHAQDDVLAFPHTHAYTTLRR